MIEGKFIRSKLGLGIFEAVARVDGKVVAQAEMMCAIPPRRAQDVRRRPSRPKGPEVPTRLKPLKADGSRSPALEDPLRAGFF